MNSNIENAWKTIVTNATVEDAEFTYKTNSVAEKTSLMDLPTLTIRSKGEDDKVKLPEIVDHAAATEEYYPNTNEETSNQEDTMPTVADKKRVIIDDDLYAAAVSSSFHQDTSSVHSNSFSTLEIHKEIARGGMGVVLKGQQNSLQRDIAIKKLLNAEDEQAVDEKKKFVMEARVTAFLDHPNIIPIHELGVDHDGNPLITMKLVRGKSWKQILGENTSEEYSPDYMKEQINILINVCNALSYAHSKNIIHNDLKPANIMVGEFGEVFVMDWGIAVTTDENNAITIHRSTIQSPMGTPHYMAPELAMGQGDVIGSWTDTYLLGAILYRILMGRPPHVADNLWGCISLSAEGNIPPFRDDIPEELVEICTKSLQRNPDDRYHTMDQFKKALQDFKVHWESIQITEDSQEYLVMGRQIYKDLQVKSKEEVLKEHPNPYCPLSRALFGFGEALRIWPENPKALAGNREGAVLYFKLGLIDKNYDLCRMVLAKTKEFGYDASELEEELQQHLETADLGKDSPREHFNNEFAYRETTPGFDPEMAFGETMVATKKKESSTVDYSKWVVVGIAVLVGIFIGKLF
ncbi:serine/threonine-protein kinase [Candidatus Uabimicrobium amorphum]|uniref:Protein kinase n=1 Tax=Uabimicrobium amorphum TaxID=2596890 RepID=A0A5S9INN2_UABAM|nr:serine/threonine-protein kinase [Candidatus Uabimicrobium amorphum]BBM84857.1 protein kinase [Candidatus Uabimicrobium amorphum]